MAITAREQLAAYLVKTAQPGDHFGEAAAEFALASMSFFSEHIAQNAMSAGEDDDGTPITAADVFPTEAFDEVFEAYVAAEGNREDIRNLRTPVKGE